MEVNYKLLEKTPEQSQDYKKKEMYGWFSLKQAKIKSQDTHLGKTKNPPASMYYLNMMDKKVEVTMVSQTKNHQCSFDDIKFVGKVYKYIGPAHYYINNL